MSKYGVIYIANNNERDGGSVFKVGKSTQPDKRMVELNSETSNFGKFEIIARFVVSDIDKAEYECHQNLAAYRIQERREFFKIEQDKIVQIVERVVLSFKAEDKVPESDSPHKISENSFSSTNDKNNSENPVHDVSCEDQFPSDSEKPVKEKLSFVREILGSFGEVFGIMLKVILFIYAHHV